MNEMSRQISGSRDMADPGSAQEYQDNEFSDELDVFLQLRYPIVALATYMEQPKLADKRTQQDEQAPMVPTIRRCQAALHSS